MKERQLHGSKRIQYHPKNMKPPFSYSDNLLGLTSKYRQFCTFSSWIKAIFFRGLISNNPRPEGFSKKLSRLHLFELLNNNRGDFHVVMEVLSIYLGYCSGNDIYSPRVNGSGTFECMVTVGIKKGTHGKIRYKYLLSISVRR